jgi:hypothetical protein
LLEHVLAMGDAANQLSLTASGQSQVIEGSICISASEVHATFLLPPIIAKLRGDKKPLAKLVYSDLERITFPIWLTTLRELNTNRRVRMVFDLLATEITNTAEINHRS